MICRPGYNMLDSDPGSMRPIISTPLWQEDDTITIPVHIDRYPAKGWWWCWLRRERDDTITILPLTAIDPGPAFSGAEQSIAAGVNRLNDLSHCRVHYSQFNLMATLCRTFFVLFARFLFVGRESTGPKLFPNVAFSKLSILHMQCFRSLPDICRLWKGLTQNVE